MEGWDEGWLLGCKLGKPDGFEEGSDEGIWIGADVKLGSIVGESEAETDGCNDVLGSDEVEGSTEG